jgi:isopenicillin N synthase-like dioxygenase
MLYDTREMIEEIEDTRSSVLKHLEPAAMLEALQRKGYFIMPLSEDMFEAQEEMFRQFDIFDERPVAEKAVFSLSADAIGENNGWHGAGGLSRYNQCREGVIFQSSSPVWPMLSAGPENAPDDFSNAHENFRTYAHLLANSVMEWLAIALELPEPDSYFTANGSLDIIGGSQFHVKKLRLSDAEDFSALRKTPEDGRCLTMRAHRDPSVISIVFHKRRSVDEEQGSGLQFKDPVLGSFVSIADAEERELEGATSGLHSGGARCVVIAGSILELLTASK